MATAALLVPLLVLCYPATLRLMVLATREAFTALRATGNGRLTGVDGSASLHSPL